jgi:hypothetical protein
MTMTNYPIIDKDEGTHGACNDLNRHAADLAERLADDGREYEPEPDLTYLWETSAAVRGRRPHDKRYLVMNGKPYSYRHRKSPKGSTA